MNRKTGEVLDQFLSEFGNPPGRAIENSQEHLLDLFASSRVHFGEVREMPVPRSQPFRFAWAAGIALAVVLVNVVVWRQIADEQRRPLLESRLLAVEGRLESQDGVQHLIARRLTNLSTLLGPLAASSRDFR